MNHEESKKIVQGKFPNAIAKARAAVREIGRAGPATNDDWVIVPDHSNPNPIGEGPREPDAWIDAAKKIKNPT